MKGVRVDSSYFWKAAIVLLSLLLLMSTDWRDAVVRFTSSAKVPEDQRDHDLFMNFEFDPIERFNLDNAKYGWITGTILIVAFGLLLR